MYQLAGSGSDGPLLLRSGHGSGLDEDMVWRVATARRNSYDPPTLESCEPGGGVAYTYIESAPISDPQFAGPPTAAGYSADYRQPSRGWYDFESATYDNSFSVVAGVLGGRRLVESTTNLAQQV